MSISKLKLSKSELSLKEKNKIKRYPNLITVLMVEDFLKEHRDLPMKISEIKKQLPKQIMHQTLMVILEYLWRNGKIIYGPRGIQWIATDSDHIKKMMGGH